MVSVKYRKKKPEGYNMDRCPDLSCDAIMEETEENCFIVVCPTCKLRCTKWEATYCEAKNGKLV